jgi:hypothetical protein
MTTSQATTTGATTKQTAWDTWRTSSPLTIPARREQRRLLTDPMVAKLSLRSSEIRVEVHRPEPVWLYPVLHRLQHLAKLDENWDSYGGLPPTDKSIFVTLAVLAHVLRYESGAPMIFPLAEGGVQVEWHRGGEELEIRAAADGAISAFRFDERAGRGEELDNVTLSDLTPLLTLSGNR